MIVASYGMALSQIINSHAILCCMYRAVLRRTKDVPYEYWDWGGGSGGAPGSCATATCCMISFLVNVNTCMFGV